MINISILLIDINQVQTNQPSRAAALTKNPYNIRILFDLDKRSLQSQKWGEI